MRQVTPWAVLLCKWSDDDSEPQPRDYFERLFTTTGVGQLNMLDFFHEVSHRKLDLSGSQVFGWLTLAQPRSAYTGSGPNQAGRWELVTWARAAADLAGINLTPFYGIVVCMNIATDFWGGGRTAVLAPPAPPEPQRFDASGISQEMGHGYGLDHSRRDGSTADYEDPWDTMSTWNSCYMAAHPEWVEVGPGLNAANMRGRGWLDATRVWRPSTTDYCRTITLRPLHRLDLPGHVVAEVPGPGGPYFVEFRVQERWDAAIPRPAVLVHRLVGNASYLMPSAAGSSDIVSGDAFEAGLVIPGATHLRIDVQEIDERQRTARLQICHTSSPRPSDGRELFWGQLLGGVPYDGGGVIIVNGRAVPIPPWDPTIRILEHLAALQAADLIPDKTLQDTVRAAVLDKVDMQVAALREGLAELRSPAERTKELPPIKG